MSQSSKVSQVEMIKALASANRQRIMKVILNSVSGPISPREIAHELRQPLANVSYHVRVLAKCEVIDLMETRPVRGSVQHFYSPHRHFMALPWAAAVLDSFVRDAT